jgi:hypothetical protein
LWFIQVLANCAINLRAKGERDWQREREREREREKAKYLQLVIRDLKHSLLINKSLRYNDSDKLHIVWTQLLHVLGMYMFMVKDNEGTEYETAGIAIHLPIPLSRNQIELFQYVTILH